VEFTRTYGTPKIFEFSLPPLDSVPIIQSMKHKQEKIDATMVAFFIVSNIIFFYLLVSL